MREERVAKDGAGAERKEGPEQRERPFRAPCGAPSEIHAVIAMEDRMQRIAMLALDTFAREDRDNQAGSYVDGETPDGGVDGERPATPGQFHKEPVEQDKPRRFGKHHEQAAEAESHKHRATAHPRKPSKAEIGWKELS